MHILLILLFARVEQRRRRDVTTSVRNASLDVNIATAGWWEFDSKMVTRKVPADFICLNDENRAKPRLDKHAVILAELIDLWVRSSIEDRSRLFDSSYDL